MLRCRIKEPQAWLFQVSKVAFQPSFPWKQNRKACRSLYQSVLHLPKKSVHNGLNKWFLVCFSEEFYYGRIHTIISVVLSCLWFAKKSFGISVFLLQLLGRQTELSCAWSRLPITTLFSWTSKMEHVIPHTFICHLHPIHLTAKTDL